jgi:glucose/arabinose dehydrogenase
MKTNYKGTLALVVVGVLVGALSLFSVPLDAAAGQQFDAAAGQRPDAAGQQPDAATEAQVTVIASGLDNPRGLAFGPEGALYVAEAGEGGDGPCVPGPFGGPVCYGPSGAVTRILDGEQEQYATGLSSYASPEGGQAFGPQDVAFRGRGGAYVPVGVCFQPNDSCGRLIHVAASGKWRAVADILAWEIENNPDGAHDGESNPYAALALPGERIVADAAGNTLLRVAPNGQISMLALFPARMVEGPEPGSQILMDSVPTSVAVGPDGAYYVSELTGFPFPLGGARIYRVEPGETPEIYADGFTNVIDIAFENDGSLLVLEIAKNSMISGDPAGALIRLYPDGSRETLLEEGLTSPTAVAIGDDGAIYISNYGQNADIGEVLRIELDD